MKAYSDILREPGKDFIFRHDLIPSGYDQMTDEEWDKETSFIPIEILVEKFNGIVIVVERVSFREDETSDDDTIGVDISYHVLTEQSKKYKGDLSSVTSGTPEFVTVVGDIVSSLLLIALEKSEEIINESGKNNINESSKK